MRHTVLALACTTVFAAIPAFAADHVVLAKNGPGGRHFDPSTVTIAIGDTVTFKNDPADPGFHNVASDDGAITAFHCSDACGDAPVGNISNSTWSSTVTFPDAGTIGYYCEAHGASGGVGMSGLVIVQAALPEIDVTPASLTASAVAGGSVAVAFDIDNNGNAALDWTADTSSAGCATPVTVPWIVLDPTGGSIAAGAGAATVDVTLDAATLTPGVYSANICLHSNDVANDPLTLPVDFTVNPPDLIFANGFDG